MFELFIRHKGPRDSGLRPASLRRGR
jgi:hypothetical protein